MSKRVPSPPAHRARSAARIDHPPLPSPPITAPASFILATTFTSPTAEAEYLPPCRSVTSRSARDEAEVGNGVAARMLRENIVGHGNQRVLLDEHRAVLADQCQPVDVGIDDDPQIGFSRRIVSAILGQVLRQRLGVVGEFARGVAVQPTTSHPSRRRTPASRCRPRNSRRPRRP